MIKKRTPIILILLLFLSSNSVLWGEEIKAVSYVILQKGVPLKKQLSQENTIYEVRYEYDLYGTSLKVPSGTILKFTGGVIRNSPSITGLRDIDAPPYQIFDNVQHVSSISLLYPEWFGAVGNGVNDDTKAIQNAINAQINYSAIYFKRGIYRTTAPIIIPKEMKYSKIFGDVTAKIIAEHEGNCFEFNPTDIEAGHIEFKDLTIIGPNNDYGSFADNKSKGAGIQLSHAYNNLLDNCVISGFKYDYRITTGIGNDAMRSTFRFCEYGVYLDGKATNLNRFIACNIRENRREGVHIEGVLGSPALHNEFLSCYIEDNNPYVKRDIKTDVGVAFSLKRADFTVINSCYLESQYTFFNLDEYCTSSRIVDCRLAVPKNHTGHYVFRYNSSGSTIRGNHIVRCSMQSNVSNDEASVGFVSFSKNDDYSLDIYEDCEGLSIPESLKNDKRAPRFHYSIPNIAFGGSYNKMLNIGAAYQNPGFEKNDTYPYIEKSKKGCILHVNGLGHIVLGERITEDIIISQIIGLNIGDVVVIEAYCIPHSVTFKHMRYGIWMSDNHDAVIPSKQDMSTITFYKDYQGQLVEISRNF